MSCPQRDTIDTTVRGCGGDKTARVDLGLALLELLLKPGQTLTTYDIAAWTGSTNAAIQNIERRALQKVRNKFLFGRERVAGRELVA